MMLSRWWRCALLLLVALTTTGVPARADVAASGTIAAAGEAVQVSLGGACGVAVVLTGTWAATIVPEVSVDGGTTWAATVFWSPASGATQASTTANGTFQVAYTSGIGDVRVRASAYTSGTATAKLRGNQSCLSFNTPSGTQTVDTELPAAALLADGTANPTAPAAGTFLHGFDGTDWERLRCDATTRRLEVEVEAALPAGPNNIGDVDVLTMPADATELPAAVALADAASAAPTTPTVGAVPLLMNATTVDRARAVVNALDSVGTGIAACGLVGQVDDTGPSAVTENQFSTVRISPRRVLYVEGISNGNNIGINLLQQGGVNLTGAAGVVDNMANPTAGPQKSVNMIWDGVGWDRQPGDLENGTDVDVTRMPADATELTTADVDPGAGTDTRAVVGMVVAKSGGGALVGAGADGDPVPVSDDGGSLTVDGTVTANAGTGTFTVETELPAGAAGTPVHVRPSDGAAAQTWLEGDLDSGAGTQTRIMAGLAGAASGGAVPIEGTAAFGLESDVVRFPDNEPFNVAQWGGTAVTGGAGASTAGSPRTILASDDPAVTALQIMDDWDETDRAKVNLVAGQAGVVGGVGASGANTVRVVAASDDPCMSSGVAKSSAVISATGDVELVAASGSTVIYVCGFSATLGGTTNPTARFIYGTGTVCATGLTALTGAFISTATPLLVQSQGGNGTQFRTTASQALCLDLGGTGPSIAGYVTYVQQ